MGRHAAVILVSAALSAAATGAAARAASGGVCELAGADRATTTSRRCAACHDGTAGAAIEFQMAPGGMGMSHPVDVDYASVALRQPDRYVAPALLPREVPLVDGKVACTSCHDGASPDPKRVARVARLCEACHRL